MGDDPGIVLIAWASEWEDDVGEYPVRASCERPPYVVERFRTFEDAITWARERSPMVLVRLGGYEKDYYSAGERHLRASFPNMAAET
jgi:hypothetical protein